MNDVGDSLIWQKADTICFSSIVSNGITQAFLARKTNARLSALAEQKINTSIEQLLSTWMRTNQKVFLAFISLHVDILASLLAHIPRRSIFLGVSPSLSLVLQDAGVFTHIPRRQENNKHCDKTRKGEYRPTWTRSGNRRETPGLTAM